MIRLDGLRDDYVSRQALGAYQVVCADMDLFEVSPYVFASGPRQKILFLRFREGHIFCGF